MLKKLELESKTTNEYSREKMNEDLRQDDQMLLRDWQVWERGTGEKHGYVRRGWQRAAEDEKEYEM